MPGSILRKSTILFSFILSFYCINAAGQADSGASKCSLQLHGKVFDTDTKEALGYATIYVKELQRGTTTDFDGNYTLKGLCAGTYSLTLKHIGCKPLAIKVSIKANTEKDFSLPHSAYQLKEIDVSATIKAQDSGMAGQVVNKISGKMLDVTRGLSLGESLKEISGLNSIQTGPGISKPVIHGMHSNRVLILNNGVRQEGQQWGSEHAPEVDPFVASEISIIKGASSLKYGSDAIGGVILLEPKKLPQAPGISGEINLVGASNNRMGVASGMLEGAFGKALSGLSWRVQGTLKEAGNSQAPHYYLDNTGIREGDYSSALSYTKNNFGAEIYYSQFTTKIGILSASHIGNANDLYMALSAPQPIERSVFSYNIGRPYQYVSHGLLKASSYIDFPGKGKIEITFARQVDTRQEYSPDISYNNALAGLPELAFKLISHTLDLEWHHPTFKTIYGTMGANAITQGNSYSGIDYFSIIPNFRNYGAGIYDIEKWTAGKLTIEGGLRYDYRWLQVYMYDYTPVIHYVDPVHQYSNLTSSIGGTYKFSDNLSLNLNYGSAWRSPGPNELYGQGVHVSAASFEQGDSTLKVERAYNFTGSLKYQDSRLTAELGAYDDIINNFIYLKPDLKPVVLISGSYPGFHYTQANVVFRGLDLDITYTIIPGLTLTSKTTLVRAFNYSINDNLVFTPADRFENGFKYQMASKDIIKEPYIGFSCLYVAHQSRVPPNSDYTLPPQAYTLFNAEAGMDLHIWHREVSVTFSANNLTNRAYRDYLDRLRYFSDEAGRNFILRLKIPLFAAKLNNIPNPD